MLTRRSLLAVAAAPLVQSAQAQPPETLSSRRNEARPVPPAEREARIERARGLMAIQKLDAVCLPGGTSLRYFTGVLWGNSERLFACILPRQGSPFYICPAFEEDRAREQTGEQARILVWQEDENPYALIARGLGMTAGRIGVEEKVAFAFADGIAQSNRGLTLVSATPVTAGCRARKSPAELELMRLANSVTLQAYRVAWRQVREGMTNHDLTSLIRAAYTHLGFPGEVSVQTGAFSALPHGSPRAQVIREGSLVMMDDGCTVEGYNSDITRTVVLGRPSDKMRRVFDIVHRAQSAALAAARPGAACEAVDSAARSVIENAGFGPGYKYFSHRLGHGIGLDGHEWPYLVRGNRIPLEAGMTFSDEPGIYLRGEFGMRLEDDVYITEDGAQLFTPQASSLEQI